VPHNLTSSPLLSSMLATARITSRPSQRSFTVGQRLSTSAAGRGPRAAKRQAKRPDCAPAEHGRLTSDSPPPCHRAHTPDCIHTPTHRGEQPHAATDSQTPPRSTQPALQRSPTHPGHSRMESNGHGKIEDGIFMASLQPVDWPLAAAGCAHLPRHSRDISHLVISHPIYRRRFQIPSYAADNLGPVPGSDLQLHLCTLILKPQTRNGTVACRSFVTRCSHANAHD